jgi:hypothetical protein
MGFAPLPNSSSRPAVSLKTLEMHEYGETILVVPPA